MTKQVTVKVDVEIVHPDYTFEGVASKPVFLKNGKKVKPPKGIKKYKYFS